jgi:acyl-CoA synthetase (AMP-forming)/AMP-acid ligase II
MGNNMSELVSTPTHDDLPRRLSDFATLGEALDYAATGKRGLNFHDMRGKLARPYPYSEMRADALDMAYRLTSHGIGKNDRIALVAETGTDFAALFFGCIYAGRLAGAAAAADLVRRQGKLCRSADRAVEKLRSENPFLPRRIGRNGRRGGGQLRGRGHRLGKL